MGWMSLVGPRPEMPQLLARYPSEFAAARLQVRPGCTGLWQVSESSTKLIYETPEYDLAYVHNVGLLLDAWILGRTLRMWATGFPACGLDAVPSWAWYRWQAAPHLSFEPVVTHHRPAVPRVDIDLPELHRQEADRHDIPAREAVGA
jgi:hypothetical protein